jgi:hypothetical protein
MQTHNGTIAQRGWSTEERTKQGAMYTYFQAAVPSPKDSRPVCPSSPSVTSITTVSVSPVFWSKAKRSSIRSSARPSTRGSVSPARYRINGGRPEDGQFAYTEHSDAVVALSPPPSG